MSEITFAELQKANKQIKTTNIKGKEYAEVNQRIKAFRMVYPTGCISTKMLSNDNGLCVFQAIAKDEDGNLLGVGHSYEKEGSSFINKTSYIENCETSAVGRALGMAGFGIDTSIASYEEVSNAIKQQDDQKSEEQKADERKTEKTKKEKIEKSTAISFHNRCHGDEELEKFMLKGCGIKSWDELTNEKAYDLNVKWDKFVKMYEESKE